MPSYAVVLTSPGSNKVALIKEIREFTGLDLTAAKQLTDRPNSVVMRDVERSEAERVAQILARVGAEIAVVDDASLKATTSGDQTLVLTSPGSRPLEVVRVLRDQLGLGLQEAHHTVGHPPVVLLENAPREQAVRVAQAIETVGGVVELSSS